MEVNGWPANEPKYVKRGNYGVRVARSGFNAATCADSQLLFNSGWPILQVAKVVSNADKGRLGDSGNTPSGSQWRKTNEFSTDFMTNETQRPMVNGQYVITSMTTEIWLNNVTYEIARVNTFYGLYHGLGYPPFFFTGKDVGHPESDKILLFNLDVSRDVDYPYTSKPFSMFSDKVNYGIKSKAYYAKNMPRGSSTDGVGVSSNIVSKMVQAVKTEQTTRNTDTEFLRIAWYPPQPSDDSSDVIDDAYQFEYYSYIGGSQIFSGSPPVGIEGGDFYQNRSRGGQSIGMWPLSSRDEFNLVGYGVNYINSSNPTLGSIDRVSLIVLRSPMVAPEVEEVEYV